MLAFLSFYPAWAKAMEQITEQIVRAMERNIDVNVWIFKDYLSLRDYVAEGIIKCQREIVL